MKRWLIIALAAACVFGTRVAFAQQDDPLEDREEFPRVAAVIDSMYAGRARILDVQFFEGFTPGGSRDIPAGELRRAADIQARAGRDQQVVLIGATDPMRFHASRRKISNLNNYTLGMARANYLNQRTGNRGKVSTSVLMNDRRGVYVVTVEPSAAGVSLADHTHPYAALDHTHEGWLRITPQVGATWVRVEDEDYFAPQVGVAVRKSRYEVFMNYGRTFRDNEEVDGIVETGDDRIFSSGLRVGREQGLFFQLAFIDARELIPYLDMYTSRAVGGTLGLGFGWHPDPLDLRIHGGVGLFDTVTPEELEDEAEFGFHLGLGIGYTF